MAVFNEIKNYFERNNDLYVLFVFDQRTSIQTELSDPALNPWDEYPDYEYVIFDGGWFNIKYKIETEWKDKKGGVGVQLRKTSGTDQYLYNAEFSTVRHVRTNARWLMVTYTKAKDKLFKNRV